MFEKVMNYIKDFLENIPEDIYDFSCELEGMLIIHYDEMYKAVSYTHLTLPTTNFV